jgi:predicted Fe-Mo cluster-binding NifX family protein
MMGKQPVMRIAVASDMDGLDAEVSFFGGRAPYYLIVDERGELLDSFRNPYEAADRHAGHELSQLLIDENVDAVIAGLFGPAMIDNLSRAGVKCVVKQGSIRDALREFLLLSR